VSAWAAVLDDLETRGGTVPQVAARLDLPPALVRSIIDHAERLGVLAVAGTDCGSSCPTGPDPPAACAGCPLVPRSRR
jgi:hypothetical protein